MGYYINPLGMTKEEFLDQVGLPIPDAPAPDKYKATIGVDKTPALAVCLVDNGAFTAAGIAYSEAELEAFQSPLDGRPKRWYYVPIDDLKEYLSIGLLTELTQE